MAARVFARRIRGGAAAQVAGVPAAKFDAASAPPAPDYANRDAWSSLPSASTDKPADCFYIHPTAYFGDQWNASFDDAAAAAQVDQGRGVAGRGQLPAKDFHACRAGRGAASPARPRQESARLVSSTASLPPKQRPAVAATITETFALHLSNRVAI